jgi:microcystin-dependent protein
MSQPFIAEIKIISFNFPPKGWAFCNGQLLPINQNQALFALLGTTYGGNGQTSFALPNLQGRMPLHVGGGIALGQTASEVNHTLLISEMPSHTHAATGSSTTASVGDPTNNLWATGNSAYNPATNTTMNSAALASAGSSSPHNNMPPYTVLNFCIALVGVFPSRN